jgi:hypothetical protein
LDEKGNVVKTEEQEENEPKATNDKAGNGKNQNQKQYTPINNYKPTGNLIYGKEMFDKLEKKVNMS